MPHTFFIGDHAQMLKHLTERVILKVRSIKKFLLVQWFLWTCFWFELMHCDLIENTRRLFLKDKCAPAEKDNVAVVNATNLEPLLSKADVKASLLYFTWKSVRLVQNSILSVVSQMWNLFCLAYYTGNGGSVWSCQRKDKDRSRGASSGGNIVC